MVPTKFASKENLALKASFFNSWQGTTHWPHTNIHKAGPPLRDGKEDPMNRKEPREKPIITDRLLQLAGAKAY